MSVYRRIKGRILNYYGLKYKPFEFIKLVLLKHILYNRYIASLRLAKNINFKGLNLNDLHFFVISLRSRQDRRETISESFKRFDLRFEFIDGVVTNRYDNSIVNSFSDCSLKFLSEGSIGCIKAHLKALKTFLQGGQSFCVILEDDVILGDRFKVEIERLLTEIPVDMELLYLGSGNKFDYKYWVSNNLYVPVFPRRGAYAYIISREGAQKIIDSFFPVTIVMGGLDTIIGRFVSRDLIKAYHIYPDICLVDKVSPSNIYNLSNPRKRIIQTV